MDGTISSDKQTMTESDVMNCLDASVLKSFLDEYNKQPHSPASSLSSHTTGDTTFEPSIDMVVNDFDDEQTLTEEEALANLEEQDPADEIATLEIESEMPLEELLAQYRQIEEHQQEQNRRRQNRKMMIKKNKLRRRFSRNIPSPPNRTIDEDIIVIEESDDDVEILKGESTDTPDGSSMNVEDETEDEVQIVVDDVPSPEDIEEISSDVDFIATPVEFSKRSHLLELYPENYANNRNLDADDEDFTDDDDEDAKSTIMVGSAYQATIPVGLSKYGDVLPYENEDILIWEPSQVGEPEVEGYLNRVKEIKSTSSLTLEEEVPSSNASEPDQSTVTGIIKDDEQALHLLVQCGYNFKEALRRKRLNAVPLTGSMSLWSEEECKNFEEGIQSLGKDFRRIRQTQVRTRSIREMVQFYYLWKKTNRRDPDLIDSDAVDHMENYLNVDERDKGSNGGGKNLLASETVVQTQKLPVKKRQHRVPIIAPSPATQQPSTSKKLKNYSIMNLNKRSTACSNHSKKMSWSSTATTDDSLSVVPYRRRSSLLAANKSHRQQTEEYSSNINIFTADCFLASTSQTATKIWRSMQSRSTSATATSIFSKVSSTSDANSSKKKLL